MVTQVMHSFSSVINHTKMSSPVMYLHSWGITRVVCGLKIGLAIITGWDGGLKVPK